MAIAEGFRMTAHRVENDARGPLPALLWQQRDLQCAERVGGSSQHPVAMRPADHAVPACVGKFRAVRQFAEHERHRECPSHRDVGCGWIDDGEGGIEVVIEMGVGKIEHRRGIVLHELRPRRLKRPGEELWSQIGAGTKRGQFEHPDLLMNAVQIS
jgi:hypothetical protein